MERKQSLILAGVLCAGVLSAGAAMSSPPEGAAKVLDRATVPPVMVQLDIVFDEEKDPATILVPFGKEGTLQAGERKIAITPEVIDGERKIGLNIEVFGVGTDARTDNAIPRSEFSSVIQDGGVFTLGEERFSIGAQVVASQTFEPVSVLTGEKRSALCDDLSRAPATPVRCDAEFFRAIQ